MKRFLTILVMLAHINFGMFIPQVDEQDSYTRTGKLVNDINSLSEFINVTFFGNTASYGIDEDDDTARYYHVVKAPVYQFAQEIIELKPVQHITIVPNHYPEYTTQHPTQGFANLSVPPPKA